MDFLCVILHPVSGGAGGGRSTGGGALFVNGAEAKSLVRCGWSAFSIQALSWAAGIQFFGLFSRPFVG